MLSGKRIMQCTPAASGTFIGLFFLSEKEQISFSQNIYQGDTSDNINCNILPHIYYEIIKDPSWNTKKLTTHAKAVV